MTSRKSTEIDTYVARRLLAARKASGLSQMQLAEHIGVSFQQLQKYENGGNRVTPGRLYELAKKMNVPIGFFFEGLDSTGDKDPLVQINDLLRRYAHLDKIRLLTDDQWTAVLHVIIAFAEVNNGAKP